MRLTRLEFSASPDFPSSALAMMSGAAHQTQLLLVLQQLGALVKLRCLSLSGVGSREAQALDGTAALPLLEELRLPYCSVAANDGFIDFLGRSCSLAAVGVHEVYCMGSRSALAAFREALARRIAICTSITVQFWPEPMGLP